MADQELIARIAAGDREAFRALHARHHGRVYRLACGVLLSPDDAHDVSQEVFLRLLAAAPKWPREAPVSAWLHRVTMNESLDVLRRFRRRARRWLISQDPPQPADQQLAVHQTVQWSERASLEFRDISARNLFAILSDIGGQPIIIDPCGVDMKLNVRLRNIPLKAAISTVCETHPACPTSLETPWPKPPPASVWVWPRSSAADSPGYPQSSWA